MPILTNRFRYHRKKARVGALAVIGTLLRVNVAAAQSQAAPVYGILMLPEFIIAVLLLTIVVILALSVVRIRNARNALEKLEEKYRTLFDGITDGLILADQESGSFVEVNAAICKMTGFSKAEMIHFSIKDIHPEGSFSHVFGQFEKLACRESALAPEIPIQRKNGAIFHADVNALSIRIQGRNLLLGIFRDISERKRSEDALRESQEQYRRFVETANEGIWAMDANYRTTFVNRRMTEMLGYPMEEMLGKSVESFMFDEDLIDHQTKMEKRQQGRGGTYERRFRCKDGREVWTQVSATAITDSAGTFAGSHALFTDITERKYMLDALRENEARFRGYFDLGLIGMAVTSLEKGWVECNDCLCNMLGYSRKELFEMTWQELTHPEDVAADVDQFNRVIGGEIDAYRMEKRFIRKDGALVYTEISVRAVRRSDGRVDHFLAMIQDITERKLAEEGKIRLEAQLRQAQKMEAIGSLAGGIAHDLNNILFPISGLSEMLLDDISPDNPIHASITQIHKSAKRGSDLVKQILAFSRQSNPQKLPIRIQPILKETLKLAQATIPRKIEIISRIDADCGMVSADPTQIHQIMMNLITNAYHAVEKNSGTIHVELKATNLQSFDENNAVTFQSTPSCRYACITVSDTGSGIDPALIHRIFEPYFTTKEQGKGTGLGLSVVHGIIKQYGGDIRVYSEIGKGTTFDVYLPLLDEVQDIQNAADAKHPSGSESILLVDDEEPIVHLEQMALERLGYRITAHTNSLDALDVFRADPHRFDLVVSDRGMPNMTGDQLAGELMSIRPEIPIILCTGFSTENDELRARTMGIKGVLMKPVATGDLAAMVRKVLDEEVGRASPKPNRERIDGC